MDNLIESKSGLLDRGNIDIKVFGLMNELFKFRTLLLARNGYMT